MASRIHFKYWKNILISRLHEQLSLNDLTVAPEKISNFKNMNILYIALEHVIWRFEYVITFAKYLRNFAKSVLARISAKFNFAKQLILTSEFFSGAIEESFHKNCS